MKTLLLFIISLSAFSQGVVVVPGGVGTVPGGTGGGTPSTAVYLTRATDQAGTDKYCRSTSGNDTYVCSVTPALTVYTTGGCFILNGDTANTGAATININSVGVKSILSPTGAALSNGDITANKPISLCYDGTQFIIQGASTSASTVGFTATATSSTLLDITAGVAEIGLVRYSSAASSGTLSGSTASSTAYGYITSAGVYTIGHNGAATLTCSVCVTATGVTGFPTDSIPLFTATYVSNVWTTITSYIPTTRRDILAAGTGISLSTDGAGVVTIATTASPASFTPYFPFGSVIAGGSNTTVFAANETRWVRVQLPAMTTTGIRVASNTAIGGGKGIRWALADSSGTILVKTAVNTTCSGTASATYAICQAAWSAPYTNTAGNYYIGTTTDSTVWDQPQGTLGALYTTICAEANQGATPYISGSGTAGSGTGASVDFGPSMGSLAATYFPCNNSSNTFTPKTHFFTWFY